MWTGVGELLAYLLHVTKNAGSNPAGSTLIKYCRRDRNPDQTCSDINKSPPTDVSARDKNHGGRMRKLMASDSVKGGL